MEGIVARHPPTEEAGEEPERIGVGDALAEFAEVPVLDALQHEGAQYLCGVHAETPGAWPLEPAHQILIDQGDQLAVLVEQAGDPLQQWLQDDALGLEFQIREAMLRGGDSSHGAHPWVGLAPALRIPKAV